MSTKELVYNLIDKLTESQLQGLVMLLQGYVSSDIEEIEPDEWDLKMIKQAEEENDGETISLESFAKELGINHDDI